MSLTIKELIEEFNDLSIISNEKSLDKEITVPEISRPGIELMGYLKHFPSWRIQLLGSQEICFLRENNCDIKRLKDFINSNIPVIIICRGETVGKQFIDIANDNRVPVLSTKMETSKFQSMLFTYLEEKLAPITRIHGVCLNIFGTGVIIKGDSGIGKSEVALELIHRGHFLIADDAVILKFIDEHTIIASAPELLKNHLEIRGIGIIDVQKLYGVTSVLDKTRVKLILEIKPLDGTEDRIGNDCTFEEIEGIKIPKLSIPITSGRNVANLIETAVANFNLKTIHGFNSAKIFNDDLNKLLMGEKDE